MSNPVISIFLPAFKSENLLQKIFFAGLHNSKVDLEVIIYDNGGNGNLNPEEIACRCYCSSVKVIGDGKNIGLNAALNECAKIATGDYFYLCHTDMYLMPGWDTSLLDATRNLVPGSYLFCSRSIEPGYSHIPSQIRKDYGDESDNFNEKLLLKEYKQYLENKIVVNARMPFFLSRSLWDRIGGVDERFFSFCTDDDLIQQCYDARVRRFHMVYESLVYHLQGKSNNQQKVDKDEKWPYELFVSKWKDKYPAVHHPGQYHPKLIPFETRVR